MHRMLLTAGLAVLGLLATAAAPAAQAPIRLLEAGREPRQELRPRYAPGHSERVVIEDRSRLEGSSNDRPELESLESMQRLTLALDAEAVEPDGSARVRFEIVAASLHTSDARRTADELQRVAAQLVGTTGWWRLDSRGAGVDAEVNARPDGEAPLSQAATKNLQRMLRNWTVPLPAEAVGVGARWEQVSDTLLEPESTTTFELLWLEGDRAQVDFSIRNTRSAGPDGAILEHRIIGKGSLTFDARRLLSATAVETDLSMRTLPGVNTPIGPRVSSGRQWSSRSVVPQD